MRPEHQELLRRLAVNDEGALESLLATPLADAGQVGLDAKAAALVRLAALVALDCPPATYQWSVTAALAAGATDGEVIGVLAALAPVVGSARLGSALPEIALAIGCDLGVPGDG